MKRRTACAVTLALLLLLAVGCAGRPSDSFAEEFEEGAVRLIQKSAVIFSDGENADLYRWDMADSDVYLLADGTRLLTIRDPSGPEQGPETTGGQVAQLDDLDDQTQTAIAAYYKRQGTVYDEGEEVSNAYEEYLRCQASGETYAEDRTIWQETSATFSNRHIICFQTTVSLPVEGEMARQLSHSTVFDTETGETINQWELFALSEQEVRAWLADMATGTDAALSEEIASVLEAENILLFPDRLEVQIPAGALPSRETGYGIVIAYDEEILSLLNEWARPEQ